MSLNESRPLLGHSGPSGFFNGLSGSSGPFGRLDGLSGTTGFFNGLSGSSGPFGRFDGLSGNTGTQYTATLSNAVSNMTIKDYIESGGSFSKKNQMLLQNIIIQFPIAKVSDIHNLTSKPTSRVELFGKRAADRPRHIAAGMANLVSSGTTGAYGNLGSSGTTGAYGNLGSSGTTGAYGNLGNLEHLEKLSKILNPLADVCLINKFGLVLADNSDLPQIMIDDFGKVLHLYDQEGSTTGTWIVIPGASANKSHETDSEAVKWANNFSKAVPNMINQANNDVTRGVDASSTVQPDFTPLKRTLRIYANKNDYPYTVKLNNNESVKYDCVVVQLPKEFQNNTLMLFKEELMV